MKRTVLVLLGILLMAAMMAVSALSGTAQENDQYGAAPKLDQGATPPENATQDGSGSGSQETLCAPEWLQEWHQWWGPEGGWWYFWWYQWCHDSQDGWFRSYDGWDWGPPIMF